EIRELRPRPAQAVLAEELGRARPAREVLDVQMLLVVAAERRAERAGLEPEAARQRGGLEEGLLDLDAAVGGHGEKGAHAEVRVDGGGEGELELLDPEPAGQRRAAGAEARGRRL